MSQLGAWMVVLRGCACEVKGGGHKAFSVDRRWMLRCLHNEDQIPEQDRAYYPSVDAAGFPGDPCWDPFIHVGSVVEANGISQKHC